jgi:hypothetical protein
VYIEKADVDDSKPAYWDPKALQRVYYPQKKDQPTSKTISSIMKAQTEQYAAEYARAEIENTPDQLGLASTKDAKSTQDISGVSANKVSLINTEAECYNLQYPEGEKAADLKEAYETVTDSIIVTVWFNNYQNQWGQNLFNQDVRGTLWKLICKYHINVIYTEADMSLYNNDISNYRKLANQLKLDLTNLYQGPTVLVMYNQYGDAFRTAKGPRDLIAIVDDHIKHKEISEFGAKILDYDLQNEVLAMNHYDYYMPSSEVQDYRPKMDDFGNEIKAPLRQSVHLRPVPEIVYDYYS